MKLKESTKSLAISIPVNSFIVVMLLISEKVDHHWSISYPALILIGIIISIAFCFFIFLILFFPQMKKQKFLKDIIDAEGYSERYFYEHSRMISRIKSPALRTSHLIMMSSAYSGIGNIQMAISTIRQVDTSGLMGINLCVYYNNLMYYYLQAGDIVNAEKIYPTAKPLIEKYIKNPKYAGMLHTLAVREYMVGNYQQSLGMLQNIISAAQKDSSTFGVAKLDMGRVYIKLGDLEKARELLMEVPKTLKTDYSYWQAQQLLAEISGVEINS